MHADPQSNRAATHFAFALQVAYSVLGPGESKLYLTYHNHCWIFRELLTGRRMNIDQSQVMPELFFLWQFWCLFCGMSVLNVLHVQAVFAKKDALQTVRVQAPPVLVWQVIRQHTH